MPSGHNAVGAETHVNALPSGHSALPSGHNAVDDETPVVIDLLDVKEEEVENCFHTLLDHNDEPWSYYRDLEVSLWHGNEMTGAGGVQEFIQSLDSTLFQYDMRAWYSMQQHIRNHAESFKFFKMNTSGHRGFMMICKS